MTCGIASHNVDDAKHYRDLFLDLRNLPARQEVAIRLGDYPPASAADNSCALRLRCSNLSAPSARVRQAELLRIGEIFDHFPFAEDPSPTLARRAISAPAPAIASCSLGTVVDGSPRLFLDREGRRMFLWSWATAPARKKPSAKRWRSLTSSPRRRKFHARRIF